MNVYGHSGNDQRGFSIVELLVATAVSAILLGGVVTIFLGWRTSSQVADQISQRRDSGRRAVDALAEATRSADYHGCTKAPRYSTSTVPEPEHSGELASPAAIRAYAPQDPQRRYAAQLAPDAAVNSEILLIRGVRAGGDRFALERPMRTPDDPLFVIGNASAGIAPGDLAMVYSCTARAHFVVTQVEGNLISHDASANAQDSLGYAFGVDAEVVPLATSLFYLGRSATNTEGLSLWRRTGNAEPHALIHDVDGMRLQYGVDENADGVVDGYRTAGEVTDWTLVRSVIVELLIAQSSAAIRDVARPEPELFNAVIALRNREL